MFRAESERGFGERFRPHVVGRRIHEIAPEGDGAGDALDARAVDALRRAQTRRFALTRLVAREGIGRQKERQRRLRRRVDAIAKSVEPLGQRSRELSGKERIARLWRPALRAEKDSRRAIGVRRDQKRAGLRLKARSSARRAVGSGSFARRSGQSSLLTKSMAVASGDQSSSFIRFRRFLRSRRSASISTGRPHHTKGKDRSSQAAWRRRRRAAPKSANNVGIVYKT